MNIYEKYVLPKFLNCACGSTPIEYQRKKIVPKAKGLILEIGIGSGLNLPFYDKSKVEKFWGLDPSEELSLMAKEKAEELGLEINFLSCGAEDIPLPDNHIDTAVVTYTMCTIPEVLAANKEIIRILKPNGKLLFCEHGLSPDKKISKWQSRINPIWGKIAGGCRLNRDIPKILNDSGFDIIEMEEMYLPNTPKFAGYNYWGTAVINY
jgi:ubiquinone/menaquinone biosynthesis C-methylase UbiE